ncbi:MAG: bleomycin resistance protein [Chloroflexi bacterium]|nr:bleomycin resistance protein [Chloroflexota bacterium]
MFDSVDCVRLYVADLEAGLRFYRDQLGHELIWRTDRAVGLRIPNSEAEIVLHTEPHPPEVCFKVPSADEAAQRFGQMGGSIVVPPFDIEIGRLAVVRDPWGNTYVMLDVTKGLFATDEHGNVIGNLPPGVSPG